MLTKNNYMIGVDIGTTSTKAVLFTKQGQPIADANYGYDLYTPNVAVAEQDPEEIFEAVIQSVASVMKQSKVQPEAVQFISFSSAMHSLIAMDEHHEPLTKCITWADNRSAVWAKKIQEDYDGLEVYKRTGTPIHSMSPLSKIMWLEKEHPEIASKTAKYIGIKEYVFFKLFQEYVMDHSIASATGMMNLRALDWDEGALKLAGIHEEKLPRLVETTETFTEISPFYQAQMGIHPNTKFIIGASDGVLSNLGVGAIDEGEVAITIGTSGAVRTIINEPKTDDKGRVFCYALTANHWVIGGPVNNGGVIFSWLKDELATSEVALAEQLGKNPYDLLTEIAAKVEPGANGLIFHPFLVGERAPFWNPDMRGSFIGLSLSHEKPHMIRAVLEGILFNLYSVLIALNEVMDSPIQSVKATGGFARSELWRQMMANIFDLDVTIPESFESSCLGACLLGLYAEGEIEDFAVVRDMIGSTNTHEPEAESREIYQALMAIFIRTSRLLETEYENLSKLQK